METRWSWRAESFHRVRGIQKRKEDACIVHTGERGKKRKRNSQKKEER